MLEGEWLYIFQCLMAGTCKLTDESAMLICQTALKLTEPVPTIRRLQCICQKSSKATIPYLKASVALDAWHPYIHCQSSVSHLLGTGKELARPLEGPPGFLAEGTDTVRNGAETADGAERSEKPILQ